MHLVATLHDGRVTEVHAENSRPLAAQLLVGKTLDQAAQLAPAVFSLCGVAQGVAVRAAGALATGGRFAMSADTECALAIEAVKLHLWRLMLDWPVLFNRPPERTRFAFVLKRIGQITDDRSAYEAGGVVLDLVARELLAGFFNSLREPRNLGEFADACRRGGTIGDALARLIEAGASDPLDDPVPLLAPLPASVFADALPGGWPDADYCRAPHLSGDVYETGPLARHVNNPLVARLLVHRHRIAARLFARVVELSDCASRLRHPLPEDMPPLVDVAPLPGGGALARVDTARGVLLHALRLDGDTVADYAIVAPTEWNFRPGGVFEQEGANWQAPDAAYAEWRLRALALALDPCVMYDVTVKKTGEPADA
ncbi:hypothetical protein I8J34_01230 [Denitromonas sp. IR12]|uniref:Hydrogenase n=1 Tax=Denitromonas iodatirespirans TaxID=2795389 RepID=A0A944D4N9_DENI1|nr:hypothetical protein [Denitromonas iodatirespirans]